MPEPSLDGCFEKCKRALEHLETFDAEARTWLQLRPYQIVGEFEPQTNEYFLRVRLPDAPHRFSVLVGEIVHNLRSSLEHLVGQLVYKAGKTPKTGSRGNGFPVLKKEPTKGFHKRTKTRLRGVPREARAVIEEVQPYNRRSDDPTSDFLMILHGLWNADKHHSPFTTRASIEWIDLDRTRYYPNEDAGTIAIREVRPLAGNEDGAEIARLRLIPTGPKPYVYMDADVSLQIALRGGAPAVETLQLLSRDVIGVLKRFERFF